MLVMLFDKYTCFENRFIRMHAHKHTIHMYMYINTPIFADSV